MDLKRYLDNRSVWGGLAVLIGLLLLLQNLGFIQNAGIIVTPLVMVGAGAFFLFLFLTDTKKWWAVFPAAALGLGGLSQFFDLLIPGVNLAGFIVLGGMGLSFLAVYYHRRDHFWPIIPGGVLLTLGLLSLVPGLGGGFFFLGLSATFVAVYLFSGTVRATWALIPAGVLCLLGVLVITAALLRLFIPVALILLGVYLFRRSTRHS